MNRLFPLLALLVPFASFAGPSDSHTVTVTVSAINEVDITGGNVSLTIDSAVAGSNPDAVTDSSTADLAWTTNEQTKKITVATSLADVNFPLSVTATDVTGGVSGGAVVLSTTAQDFVTGISETIGSCGLSYSASAPASAGTGVDTHTVTYTITDAG